MPQDPTNPAPATPPAGASGPASPEEKLYTPQSGASGAPAGQSGPSGAPADQRGPSGPAESGAPAQTGPAESGAKPTATIDDLKKAAVEAKEKYKKDPTPENKVAAQKAVQAAKDALRNELGEKAPEKYELVLPKDSKLTAADVERISAEAKERGLSNEDAQALLERDSKTIGSYVESQTAKLIETSKQWKQDASVDPEIGGNDFGEKSEVAKRVVSRFATVGFKKALDESGFGNHPELIRIFYRIGKMMTDDQLVLPNSTTTGTKKEVADVLYGASSNPEDNKE